MEFKGTKGEWKVYQPYGYEGDVVCDGKEICTLAMSDIRNDDELKANAKLIATAPELLEMLKMCLSTMKALGANNDWVEVIEAEKLIKKATE